MAAFDLVIRRGTVLDGTGGPAYQADVGVAGGRIAALGDLTRAAAAFSIDAADRMVAPGFIDAHSHSDSYLLIDPRAVSKITQGITTEICGNCGASAAPRLGRHVLPADWADKHYPACWSSVADYRAVLAGVAPATNVRLLIGHNTLRACVMGYDGRAATPDEMTAMARLLEQCLEEGGRGLSTGLIYPPGLFATREEILALAGTAARRGAIYTSHMRSEGRGLLEALEEVLAVGRATGARLEVSHLKTSGAAHWSLVDPALELLRRARAAGVAVAADRYPYTSSNTDLDVVFPTWAQAGGREAILARLRDPATRARLRADLLAARPAESWGTITIGSTHHPEQRRFRGRLLTDAADDLGLEPVDALLQLVERDALRTTAFFAGMSEANMWRILAEPYVMLGTDASIRAPDGPLSDDYPHPRSYGSFPRYLRAALDGRTVSLAEAVRKVTALPAGHFALSDRGVLAAGKAADLVVFDPQTVADTATYGQPHQLAKGIGEVIVNGVLTVSGGQLTGHRGGRFLD